MVWCQQSGQAVLVSLYIQPSAKKTELVGEYDGMLKLKLAAPPVDGKANHAVELWLAESLGIPRKAISLRSGERSRRKSFAIEHASYSLEQVRNRLQQLIVAG